MTNEAFTIRINKILNEIVKRPQLNLFVRINPVLQEFKNTATKSSNPAFVEFSKMTFETADEFKAAFREVENK